MKALGYGYEMAEYTNEKCAMKAVEIIMKIANESAGIWI